MTIQIIAPFRGPKGISDSVKRSAVKAYHDGHGDIVEVAKRFGVSTSSIRLWWSSGKYG